MMEELHQEMGALICVQLRLDFLVQDLLLFALLLVVMGLKLHLRLVMIEI